MFKKPKISVDYEKARKIVIEHEKKQAKHEIIVAGCLLGIIAYLWVRR